MKQADTDLLDPKNDFVFKKIFAKAPDLLCDLINAVREGHPIIEEIEILNPTIEPEELTGKHIVLDIFAQDIEGKRYNVEMQVRKYRAWNARSTFYLARMLTEQLNSGEDYLELKSAIGIHLLDFTLFDQPEHADQAVWCFEMRDRVKSHVLLGQELQLNLIELPKADRLGLAKDKLAAWITFFEHWCEEVTMANIAYQPVQDALSKVKDLSADSETRRLAFIRERALHDEVSQLNAATEEGIAKGKSEGKAEQLLLLLSLKFEELPEWVKPKLSEATDEQLMEWTTRFVQTDTLEDIFESDQ